MHYEIVQWTCSVFFFFFFFFFFVGGGGGEGGVCVCVGGGGGGVNIVVELVVRIFREITVCINVKWVTPHPDNDEYVSRTMRQEDFRAYWNSKGVLRPGKRNTI